MRHLITSALPYVNGVKHLGNLVGSMLPADVYSRYLRYRGEEVLFICATDEHGTPSEIAAEAAGLEVSEFCRQQHELQKRIGEQFHLSWDYFGRTSSPQNRELTQHLAHRLEENGFIESRQMKQIYSLTDKRFLPDRYVVGTCPHCGYEMARGDQCESCTRLLEPTELKKPRSAISNSEALEVRETTHLFLLQSKLVDELRTWIESHGEWPVLTRSIALKWLNEGLRDRCITRDLSWGVPVDREGFSDKVFYVWFDAPIGYIGATAEWADASDPKRDWRSWWFEASAVCYTQFMAKDNIPFHTIGFPATILGSREPWKQPDYIKGFNWLTYYGGKFSTSQGRGVFMDAALDILPADYWRYYLMANAPESDDSEFTWEQLAITVNSDLADKFGNFVNRSLKFCQKAFGDQVPAAGAIGATEEALAKQLDALVASYDKALAAVSFRAAVDVLRQMWSLANSYVAEAAPWTLIKTDRDGAALKLRTSINLIRILAILARPFIPETCERLFACLALSPGETAWLRGDMLAQLGVLQPGRAFEVPPPLFRKLTEEDIAAWTQRFGGRDASR